MKPLPGHALRPCQHGLNINELRAVPVLLENPPAALNCRVIARKLWGLKGLLHKGYRLYSKLIIDAILIKGCLKAFDCVRPFSQNSIT